LGGNGDERRIVRVKRKHDIWRGSVIIDAVKALCMVNPIPLEED